MLSNNTISLLRKAVAYSPVYTDVGVTILSRLFRFVCWHKLTDMHVICCSICILSISQFLSFHCLLVYFSSGDLNSFSYFLSATIRLESKRRSHGELHLNSQYLLPWYLCWLFLLAVSFDSTFFDIASRDFLDFFLVVTWKLMQIFSRK